MVNAVYMYVDKCSSCQKHCHQPTYQPLFQSVPTERPLEFVAVDKLGPLSKSEIDNTLIVVITNKYLELTRAIPTRKTTVTDVARFFIED